MGIDWNKIGSILGSRAFQNVSGVAGAGISAYAAGKSNDANAAQNAAQFAARMALEQQQSTENQRQGAATAAAAASPLGANENFALRQGLMRSILPGLTNARVTPGDPRVAAAMGKGVQGGFRLPEGGIPASALASLSPAATAGAIAQRQQHIVNIDPNSPNINLGRIGFEPDVAGPIQGEIDAYQGAGQQRAAERESATASQLKAALDQNYAAGNQPEKKKGGFLSKLGGVLKFAAPIAALAIPGIGPIASAAIAGIGSGAGAAMQGGGVKGALGAGALGAGAHSAVRAGAGRDQGPQLNNTMGAAAVPASYQLPRAQFAQPAAPQARPGSPAINAQTLAAALRRGQFGR